MSRASREQAAENRAKVVEVASSLFRIKGVNGVGIDELMSAAGFTHGGFYGQFGSKDALAGEACTHAFDVTEQAWAAAGHGDAARRLSRLTSFYFARKAAGQCCPMATLSADAARAPIGGPLRTAFTQGLRRLAKIIEGDQCDDSALIVLAAVVGASVLSRASEDAALADSIERAVMRLSEA